ncbi:MAG: IS3 family transposase [Thermodesulfobacteriota bacterium]
MGSAPTGAPSGGECPADGYRRLTDALRRRDVVVTQKRGRRLTCEEQLIARRQRRP